MDDALPGALLLSASPAFAVDLREASPGGAHDQSGNSAGGRQPPATQEERIQGQGAYYPRISVEGSGGVRSLRNPTRRSLGIAGETLWPIEGDLIVDQLVFDRAAVKPKSAARRPAPTPRRRASRSAREYVALNVARSYIDYLLQQRLVAIAQDNVTFHERLAGDLREGVSKGSISIADQQQAEERLQAARARVTQAREDLDTAAIEFRTLTGIPIDSVSMPPDLSQCMPATPGGCRSNGAGQQSARSRSDRRPRLGARRHSRRQGRARAQSSASRAGRGPVTTSTVSKAAPPTCRRSACIRWTIFNGGTKEANVREQQNRADEVHGRLFERTRAAEEDVRSAWSRLTNQTALSSELETQGRISDDVLLSYREQFNIGRRSLLDVLDAQNSRYNVQQQTETARLAKVYAQYRVLASENRLIECLGVQSARGSSADRDGAVPRQHYLAGRSAGEQHAAARDGPRAGCRESGAPVVAVPVEPAPAPVDTAPAGEPATR